MNDLNLLKGLLGDIEDIIWSNEGIFLSTFFPWAEELIELSFNSSSIKVVCCVTDNGQHVIDSISFDKINQWIKDFHN